MPILTLETHHVDFFFGPFTDAPDSDVIESHFAKLLPQTSDDLVVTAYYRDLQDKYLLHIPKGVDVTETIQLDFPSSTTHLLVVAEEGATVRVMEKLVGGGDNVRHVVELFAADDVHMSFVSLQQEDPSAEVWIQQRSRIGAGAKVHWQNVTIGGHDVAHALRSEVAGADSESSVDWIFYAKDKELQMLSACNVFDAPQGGGEITMKGVAEEKAHVACRGVIDVGQGGVGTNTYLTEDVLMLDKTAKVDAVPGLEIKTNDVQASHSATVTKVTPENLFYFSARGIPEKEARQMYVLGFLGDLTKRIADEQEREVIVESVEEKFES